MVDGCKEAVKGGCIVVDLDGTLIKGNSTKLLAIFVAKKLLGKGHFMYLFSLCFLIFLNLTRLTPHNRMKHRLLEISNLVLNENDVDIFSSRLAKIVNNDVLEIFRQNNEKQILIATAAADFFLSRFIDYLEIKADFTATPFTKRKEDYIEKKGERKLQSVKDYLKRNNLSLDIFITDHYDDLPLLKYNRGKNYLINPSKKTLSKIKDLQLMIDEIITNS